MNKTFRTALTIVTGALAIAVCLHLQRVFLPDWVPLVGGVVGVTWWVCRYMHWQAWEAHKRSSPKRR